MIYPAKLADAVYVLHWRQKKTQETSEKDIKLARNRACQIKLKSGSAFPIYQYFSKAICPGTPRRLVA